MFRVGSTHVLLGRIFKNIWKLLGSSQIVVERSLLVGLALFSKYMNNRSKNIYGQLLDKVTWKWNMFVDLLLVVL